MNIERQQVGTVDVLTPIGALVDQDAERFIDLLHKELCGATTRVVVDMHEVPYVDSAALEGFAVVVDELVDRSMGLKLAAVTPTCREIFEITGISTRFRYFESVQDAVKSFL